MVHGEGPQALGQGGQGIQGHQLAAGGAHVEQLQGRRVHLVFRLQFHDHLVFVVGGVDRGDLPGAIGVIEGVFDLLGADV